MMRGKEAYCQVCQITVQISHQVGRREMRGLIINEEEPVDDGSSEMPECEIIPIDPQQVVLALHHKAQDVIDVLREALEMAERGELTGICLGGVMPNGKLYVGSGSGECSARDLMSAALASFEARKDGWKRVMDGDD